MEFHFGRWTNVRTIRLIGVVLGLLLVWLLLERVAFHREVQPQVARNAKSAADVGVVAKQQDGSIHESKVASVAFVPMTGEARNRKDRH